MELLLAIAALIVLDIAASLFGVDSREALAALERERIRDGSIGADLSARRRR